MTYRFAIIGCGQIGLRHARIAAEQGQLAAVCDCIPEKAAALAKQYGAAPYQNIQDLLAAGGIDIVVVCTPNGLHAEHSIAALKAGYHVLCEKPMSIVPTDALRMLEAAADTGNRLFIVKQNRFNPPVAWVKSILDRQGLGNIYSFQVNSFWHRNTDYFSESSWRGTLSMDGGPLFTQFSHFIDLLYWFFGDLQSVDYASGRNISHQGYMEFEDEGQAILSFREGLKGNFNYSLNVYDQNMEGSITIFGEKGTVKIGGAYLNNIEFCSVADLALPPLPEGGAANNYGSYQGTMDNHRQVYTSMIQSLRNSSSYYIDAQEALKTVEIITEIYSRMRGREEGRP